MGDRANIVLRGGHSFPHDVYLYTHWGGHEIKQTLAAALDRGRERWNDPQYLSRVIFQTMLGGDDGLTGFGISTALGDNEHSLLVVNMDKKTIHQEPDNREGFKIFPKREADLLPVDFERFVRDNKDKP